jgi:hypothetical protein
MCKTGANLSTIPFAPKLEELTQMYGVCVESGFFSVGTNRDKKVISRTGERHSCWIRRPLLHLPPEAKI